MGERVVTEREREGVRKEGWVRRESKGVWKGWMTESRVKKLEERV